MRDTVISNFKRHQLIIPDNRLRKANTAKVEQIAESIKTIGLQSFIVVVARPNMKFELVAGLHRVLAMDSLDITDYTTVCYDADTPRETLRLIEVDENLARNELSALERAKFVAERKELWDALHGELRGGEQKSHDETFDFSKETAEVLGISKQSVKRDRAISKSLAPHWDKLEELPFTPTQADLLKLAKVSTEQIPAIIKLIEQAYDPDADDTAVRFKKVAMAIKAVCTPDKVPVVRPWKEKTAHKLEVAFMDCPSDLLLDWADKNYDKLNDLIGQVNGMRSYRQDQNK